MSYAEVCKAVETIDRRYCQKDPFRLCKEMGIILLPQQLGNEPDAIKGFFLENKRIKTITVNSDLPHVIQKIIVAHEIGHAALHRKSGIHAFTKLAFSMKVPLWNKKLTFSLPSISSMTRRSSKRSTAIQRFLQQPRNCMYRWNCLTLSSAL